MRHVYLLLAFLVCSLPVVLAQENDFEQRYRSIRQELEDWDPIRGPWLATSLEAISNDQEVPDRTFPEDLTPAQMVALLPANTRSSIERVAIQQTGGDQQNQARWNKVRSVLVRPNAGCGTRMARSYGDPHIRTFDGARYSFQTVGEFVLMKSSNGVEVQARQAAMSNDFSMNTAVAVRMGDERVGIYAHPPDGNRNSSIRVNGLPIVVNSEKAYFFRNGGTIRKSGSSFTIDWPTGEKMVAQMRMTRGMRFMNINVQVSECNGFGYQGLLGNANGVESDDFRGLNDQASLRVPAGMDVFGASRELEQQRLVYLANVMADQYRVTRLSSLFDYPIGMSTETFTDRSFPRVHRTLSELSMNQRMAAQRRCEQSGVSGRDLNGCIFDNAHIGVAPEPLVVMEDASKDIILPPLDRPKPNVNPSQQEMQRQVQKAPKEVFTPLPIRRPSGNEEQVVNPGVNHSRTPNTHSSGKSENSSMKNPNSVSIGSSGASKRPSTATPNRTPSSSVKTPRPRIPSRPSTPSKPSKPMNSTRKVPVLKSPTLKGAG